MSVSFDEVWSVPCARINSFFESCGTMGCSVRAVALPERHLGALCFPQTRVIIEGEHAEELHAEFSLNFLCGGA